MQRASFFRCVLLLAAAVLPVRAYAAPEVVIGVRQILLRGCPSMKVSRSLTLLLETEDSKAEQTHKVDCFTKLVLKHNLSLPLPEKGQMSFKIEETGKTLQDIRFQVDDQGINIIQQHCVVKEDESHAYPRRRFPTYIPRHLQTLICPITDGLVEMQITCMRGDSHCW